MIYTYFFSPRDQITQQRITDFSPLSLRISGLRKEKKLLMRKIRYQWSDCECSWDKSPLEMFEKRRNEWIGALVSSAFRWVFFPLLRWNAGLERSLLRLLFLMIFASLSVRFQDPSDGPRERERKRVNIIYTVNYLIYKFLIKGGREVSIRFSPTSFYAALSR